MASYIFFLGSIKLSYAIFWTIEINYLYNVYSLNTRFISQVQNKVLVQLLGELSCPTN